MRWTTEQHNYLIHLVKQHGTRWTKIANEMTSQFNKPFSRNQVRGRWRIKHNESDLPAYRESTEILGDGSHKSDKLIALSETEIKDTNAVLKAHGYDETKWEILKAKSSMWHHHNKVEGTKILYSSQITVKPKVEAFTLQDFASHIQKNVNPIKVDIKPSTNPSQDKRLLEIPLFDQHFGNSDYDYYRPTQTEISELITSRQWQEILFVVGSDLFHNDNFHATTTKGTIIEKVDMEQAWKDARKFYEPLIEQSLHCSQSVKVMYSPGNHDEAMSWAFTKFLSARFPQCSFDDKLIEHKIHTFGASFIGVTHGDKGKKKDLHNVFAAQFPLEWAQAETKEIHTGHTHTEDAKDNYGTMVRTLATRNKTDEWHNRKGFVGAHKRFMLFEYTLTHLKRIHYV